MQPGRGETTLAAMVGVMELKAELRLEEEMKILNDYFGSIQCRLLIPENQWIFGQFPGRIWFLDYI